MSIRHHGLPDRKRMNAAKKIQVRTWWKLKRAPSVWLLRTVRLLLRTERFLFSRQQDLRIIQNQAMMALLRSCTTCKVKSHDALSTNTAWNADLQCAAQDWIQRRV